MRIAKYLAFSLAVCCLSSALPAQTKVLKTIQPLIKEKKYSEAREQLEMETKANSSNYALWLALGYVYEAEKNYEAALEALMKASELKMGVPGLAARIVRIQSVLNDKKMLDGLSDSEKQFKEAEIAYNSGDKKEAYIKYTEAVELDRNLLGRSWNIVDEALGYYKENANVEDKNLFYLGAYCFFAGQYDQASKYLRNYAVLLPGDNRVKFAKQLTAECDDILYYDRQNAAKEQGQKSAVAADARKTQTSFASSVTASAASTGNLSGRKNSETETSAGNASAGKIQTPVISIPLEQTLDYMNKREKAMAMMENFAKSEQNEQYLIIRRLGNMRTVFPEVVEFMKPLLQSEDEGYVCSAFEALGKMGEKAINAAAEEILPLISRDNEVLMVDTLKLAGRYKMLPEKAIPIFVKKYSKASNEVQRLIIQTSAAYGRVGVMILQSELEQARYSNRRPIAEILSALTQRSIESILND